MLYLLLLITLVLCVFAVVVSKQRSKSMLLFLGVIIAFVGSICMFVLYMSQDASYFTSFLKYFPIPKSLFNYLSMQGISKFMIIRLLHSFCLLFLFFNIAFTLVFTQILPAKICRTLLICVSIILGIEWLLFDPEVYIILYVWLYPAVIEDAAVFLTVISWMNHIAPIINNVVVFLCTAVMIYHFTKTPKIQYLRYNVLSMLITYILLNSAYLFLLAWAPKQLVKYSKIADITSFSSLPLYPFPLIYLIAPVVLIILCATSFALVYRYSILLNKMRNKDLQISQSIDAATITSRTFCHYIKNELLVLSAEVEEIPLTADNRDTIQAIRQHCDHLYERIHNIHQNVKENTMNLEHVSLSHAVMECIDQVITYKKTDHIEILVNISKQIPDVFIDREYFVQALINLLNNAIEAIEKAERTEGKIHISAQYDPNWISLMIRDNGIGIKQENLKNIFTPLFSTNPIKTNWGIGLSLTYKIINACNGKINVKSDEGIGTVFEILLPNIRV